MQDEHEHKRDGTHIILLTSLEPRLRAERLPLDLELMAAGYLQADPAVVVVVVVVVLYTIPMVNAAADQITVSFYASTERCCLHR